MENSTSFLDLNHYCKLVIIKYIIADCELKGKSHGNKMNYLDLVRFALAHDDLEALLKEKYYDLYNDLEFLFVTKRDQLCIDFAQLQSIHTGKAGDALWRFYADAIRENSRLRNVYLFYKPESFQPDFLDNFQSIKRALENKRSLEMLEIDLTGYSLDDLNNIGHLASLELGVRVSAEVLETICKSNPHLKELSIMSTDILGRLSDIVPHCRNLQKLKFVPKPDVDKAEYAPLAQLPNLSEMTIHGAFKNGSVLTTFEAIQKWQKPGNEFLDIVFADELPALSSVTLPRINLLGSLETNKYCSPTIVELRARYTFLELTADIDRSEEFHATFTLIEGVQLSGGIGERKLKASGSCMESSSTELASLIKVFNVNTFDSEENSQAQLVKLFGLLHPEGSFALRELHIDDFQALDQFGTSELVKIQSLQALNCTFTDWESVEHLSKLINLRHIQITVEKQLDERCLQAFCNFLNNCHGNLHGNIEYWSIGVISLNANQIYLGINSALCSAENTLWRQALTYFQRNLRNRWNILNPTCKYANRTSLADRITQCLKPKSLTFRCIKSIKKRKKASFGKPKFVYPCSLQLDH